MRVLLLACLAFVAACHPTTAHDIPNFAYVTGDVLRGGQPDAGGWRYLHDAGITTDVKLNRDAEGTDDAAAAAGIHVVSLPMPPSNLAEALQTPSSDEIAAVVRALSAGHAFVHCTHGQDRTGLVVGVYRVVHDGWPKDRAYREMLELGFHPELHGLHEWWERFDGSLPAAPPHGGDVAHHER